MKVCSLNTMGFRLEISNRKKSGDSPDIWKWSGSPLTHGSKMLQEQLEKSWMECNEWNIFNY